MPFHNIFSKEKTKNKEENQKKPKIIVDNHEKNSLVPSFLCKLGLNIEFRDLKVADYIVNNIAIERKTIPDFKSSIINKRLLFQLREIKQYPNSLIILEGISSHNIYEGIIHENAFRGFILSTILEHKIPLVFTESEEDSAKYLSVLAKKTEKSEISLRQKIPLTKDEQKQFILEGFPGIGPATASKLIKKFKSLNNIFKASERELEEILGKKAKDFIRLLE
jgi:ERCC4-type nuclease